MLLSSAALCRHARDEIALLLISSLLVLLVSESLTRLYLYLSYGRAYSMNENLTVASDHRNSILVLDRKFGWRAREKQDFKMEKLDFAGREYPVHYRTDERGFRLYGDSKSAKNKILVLGDSFTQAVQVSNDKTYYHYLRDLDVEVFAYGVDGYGTLQQYMFLSSVLEEIKPDLILLQLCLNDFLNNSYELERRSYINNNYMLRPYLRGGGEVFYSLPLDWKLSGVMRRFMLHSAFLSAVLLRSGRLLSKYYADDSVEYEIERSAYTSDFLSREIAITAEIFSMIERRMPEGVELFTFSASAKEPYFSVFKEISFDHSFEFIDSVPLALQTAKSRGEVIYAEDGCHWNERGHEIVGSALLKYLESRGVAR